VYPGPSSNVVNIQPLAHAQLSFFISEELRNDILTKNEIINFVDTENNLNLFVQLLNNHVRVYVLRLFIGCG
jgi:hypothetical protein